MKVPFGKSGLVPRKKAYSGSESGPIERGSEQRTVKSVWFAISPKNPLTAMLLFGAVAGAVGRLYNAWTQRGWIP